MFCLNTTAPYDSFKMELNDEIYVDKTEMIADISRQIGKGRRFICITKPRRFGKSVNANMLAAYYSKGVDSHSLFEHCSISGQPDYETHLNKHNVITLSLNQMPETCNSFQEFRDYVVKLLRYDLCMAFPALNDLPFDNVRDLLIASGEKYIFILDEWDSIFYKDFMTEADNERYLRFLENLLKNQSYVELAYMTGVLPIAKYSSGSALNMFEEYSFLDDDLYDRYFGFTSNEVMKLCERYEKPTFEEIKFWYDGYYMTNGEPLFNPRSVNSALARGRCRNYWTETGPMTEIEDCIKNNIDAVREDLVQLVSGNSIEIKLSGYSAANLSLESRDEILSAMVVFGFLSYHDQILRIPNHELMEKFQRVLAIKGMGKVKQIVDRSEELLKATIAMDAKKVASVMEDIHDTEVPFLQYNDENSLSCVITLAYLAARDYYAVTREEKSGKGFCDYLFIPYKKDRPAIILELKYGKTAEDAISQIKKKNYVQRVKDIKEVLFVGINYNKEDKCHECIIEKYMPGLM
ncbi:MAG: AAA family ATPase [Clostridiales bacterium]|nr:AAA family ATPase [Candidatus Blautia equi]